MKLTKLLFLICFIISSKNIFSKKLDSAGLNYLETEINFSSYDDYYIQKETIPLNSKKFYGFFNLNIQKKIKEYIKRYGKLISFYELLRIDSSYYLYLNKLNKKYNFIENRKMFYEENKTNIRSIFQINTKPFDYSDYSSTGYNFGLRIKHGEKISIYSVFDKDPYEPNNFDFVSFSLEIKNLSFIKHVILGDYNYQFGSGSAIWSGFRPIVYDNVLSIIKNPVGIKPHNSRVENGYQRGMVLRVKKIKNIGLTIGYSNKNHDSNIKNNIVTSIDKSGYHITKGNLDKKNNLNEKMLFSTLDFRYRNLYLDFIYSKTMYNKKVFLDTTKKTFTLYGLNIKYETNNTLHTIEVASNNRKKSFIFSNLIAVNKQIDLALGLYKYFKGYYNINGYDFYGNNIEPSYGLFLGHNILFSNKLSLVNNFRTINIIQDEKYTGNEQKKELISKLVYSNKKKYRFYLRIRYKYSTNQTKDENINSIKNIIEEKTNVRLDARVLTGFRASVLSRLEVSFFEKQIGFLFYVANRMDIKKIGLNLYSRFSIFNAKDYENRIYAYENDLPYNFLTFSHYGQGLKANIILRKKVFNSLSFGISYRGVNYFLKGNLKNLYEDFIRVQLKYEIN